jgi:hypothetical protein
MYLALTPVPFQLVQRALLARYLFLHLVTDQVPSSDDLTDLE